jgi:hypothetical protein
VNCIVKYDAMKTVHYGISWILYCHVCKYRSCCSYAEGCGLFFVRDSIMPKVQSEE